MSQIENRFSNPIIENAQTSGGMHKLCPKLLKFNVNMLRKEKTYILEKKRKIFVAGRTCLPVQLLDRSWTPGQPLAPGQPLHKSWTPGQLLDTS